MSKLPVMRGPEFSLKPFLDWLPLHDCDVLEVGCFAGEGTVQLLQCDKVRSVTCVDPFIGGYDDGDTASGADMNDAAAMWARRVQEFRGEKKVALFMQGYPPDLKHKNQMVYIDSKHTPDAVFNSIEGYGRLRPTILAGHDYGVAQHPGVKAVVDDLFAGHDIFTFPDYSWAVVL